MTNRIVVKDTVSFITIEDSVNNRVVLTSQQPNVVTVVQGGMTQIIGGGGGGSYLEYDDHVINPAATWIIHTGFGRYPSSVSIIVLGHLVDTDITYTDVNTVTVTFPAPVAGRAVLSG